MKTMNMSRVTARWVLAVALAWSSASVWAVDATDHDAHHPEGAASAPQAPATKASAVKARGGKAAPAKAAPAKAAAKVSMGMMDAKMMDMRGMHDRMVQARTPAERNALMPEQMKMMQEAMTMMGNMGNQNASPMQDRMPADMGTRQQMMEKRMDMMESMMQMVLDRMPQAPIQ